MFEAEVLATWRTQLEAMALTHNENADVYFTNACAYWKEDNLWRAAQGLAPTAKPVHLPVCSVITNAYGQPTLFWTESAATCPDLPTASKPEPGTVEFGALFSDGSGRRYAGPRDTVADGVIVSCPEDGKVYSKVIIVTPFGPAKWYAPKG